MANSTMELETTDKIIPIAQMAKVIMNIFLRPMIKANIPKIKLPMIQPIWYAVAKDLKAFYEYSSTIYFLKRERRET